MSPYGLMAHTACPLLFLSPSLNSHSPTANRYWEIELALFSFIQITLMIVSSDDSTVPSLSLNRFFRARLNVAPMKGQLPCLHNNERQLRTEELCTCTVNQ